MLHVPVGLLLARVWDGPRDHVLKLDRRLSMSPRGCRTVRQIASVAFLPPRVDDRAGISSTSQSTVDWV